MFSRNVKFTAGKHQAFQPAIYSVWLPLHPQFPALVMTWLSGFSHPCGSPWQVMPSILPSLLNSPWYFFSGKLSPSLGPYSGTASLSHRSPVSLPCTLGYRAASLAPHGHCGCLRPQPGKRQPRPHCQPLPAKPVLPSKPSLSGSHWVRLRARHRLCRRSLLGGDALCARGLRAICGCSGHIRACPVRLEVGRLQRGHRVRRDGVPGVRRCKGEPLRRSPLMNRHYQWGWAPGTFVAPSVLGVKQALRHTPMGSGKQKASLSRDACPGPLRRVARWRQGGGSWERCIWWPDWGLLTSCPGVSETQGCPAVHWGSGISSDVSACDDVEADKEGGTGERPAPAHSPRETARLLHHSVVSSPMKKCGRCLYTHTYTHAQKKESAARRENDLVILVSKLSSTTRCSGERSRTFKEMVEAWG